MRSLVLAVGLGCVAQGGMAEVPRVAVDIAPVHSIVSAVMGDLGQPDLIVPTGASPHGYSLRPSEARALDTADFVVWMGPNLAPWLSGPIESLAGDASVLSLLAHPDTHLLEVRQGATFADHDHDHGHDHGHDAHGHEEEGHEEAGHDAHDHDAHDHEEADHADADHDAHEHDEEGHADAGHDAHEHEEAGHDDDAGHDAHAEDEHHHEGDDPHAWLDPNNAIIWAGVIADQLGDIDPGNAHVYSKNAQAFTSEMMDLKDDIGALLAPVRGRPFVVFHDAYHYFEHRFGIEAVGAVSSNDAVAPSPARLSDLRDEIAALGAVCALTEPQFNPAILDALGATRLGELDPMGATLAPGAALYAQLLRNMAASLAECPQ